MTCSVHNMVFLHESISDFQFCAVLALHCELNFWVDFLCWVSNVYFEKHQKIFLWLSVKNKIITGGQSKILYLKSICPSLKLKFRKLDFTGTKMHVLKSRLASFFSFCQTAWHQTAWLSRSDTMHKVLCFLANFLLFIFIGAAFLSAGYGLILG